MSSETTPAVTASDGGEITVQVKCANDTKYPITIAPSATVQELKQALVEPSECPVERQRLIYSGRILKDGETLFSYKIGNGHTIHMVKGGATSTGANRANTTASTTGNAPANTTTTASTIPGINSNNNNISNTADPMEAFRNAMMGAMGGAGAGTGDNTMPGANPFMSGGFGGGMPPMDPAASARMLQNPAFMQMFSQMMGQPEFQDMMASMNPMMNTPEARAALQSPEFRQMMSNPELLGQLMGNMPSMMPGLATGQGDNMNIFGQTTGNTDTNTDTNTNTNTNTTPPEERYADQLRQLNEMGFWDADQNIRVLVATGGNVNRAVEMLLSGNV